MQDHTNNTLIDQTSPSSSGTGLVTVNVVDEETNTNPTENEGLENEGNI